MTISSRKNLKFARKSKKLTQADVAKCLGITTNAYQAIELGIRQGSIPIWDKLEELFSIPQKELREVNNIQRDFTTRERETQ